MRDEGFLIHAVCKEYPCQSMVSLPFAGIEKGDSHEHYICRLPRRLSLCRLSRGEETMWEAATCEAFHDGYPPFARRCAGYAKTRYGKLFRPCRQRAGGDGRDGAKHVGQRADCRFHPDSRNIGIDAGEAAAQSAGHVNMHLIPRYKGGMAPPKAARGVTEITILIKQARQASPAPHISAH